MSALARNASLAAPREVRGVIRVADVLHQPPHSRQTRRLRGRALEQRSGSPGHQASLGEQIYDGVDRLGDVALVDGSDVTPLAVAHCWSADSAASSAARKYAATSGLIEGEASGRRCRGCLAIWRKARASAGVRYPCCDRRCSRWSATLCSTCAGSISRSSSPSISGVDWTVVDIPASPRGSSRDGRRRARGAASRSRPTRRSFSHGPDSRPLHMRDPRLASHRRRSRSSSLDAAGAKVAGSKTRT